MLWPTGCVRVDRPRACGGPTNCAPMRPATDRLPPGTHDTPDAAPGDMLPRQLLASTATYNDAIFI